MGQQLCKAHAELELSGKAFAEAASAEAARCALEDENKSLRSECDQLLGKSLTAASIHMLVKVWFPPGMVSVFPKKCVFEPFCDFCVPSFAFCMNVAL